MPGACWSRPSADRLPRVEARLSEAKRLLFNRDREIAELTAGARRTSRRSRRRAPSTRRRTRRSSGSRRRSPRAADAAASSPATRPTPKWRLRSEIEALRSKTSEQALLIDRLQRRSGHGFALTTPVDSAEPPAGRTATRTRRGEDISEAEAAIGSVRAAAPSGEGSTVAFEREIRALKARTEDQAGEIARLKAALVRLRAAGRQGRRV